MTSLPATFTTISNNTDTAKSYYHFRFLPRDAVPERYELPPVSVCQSQVGVLSKCLDRSSSFLATRLPSTHPTQYTVLSENLCIYKNMGASPWNFLNSTFKILPWHNNSRNMMILLPTKVEAQHDKLKCHRSTSTTYAAKQDSDSRKACCWLNNCRCQVTPEDQLSNHAVCKVCTLAGIREQKRRKEGQRQAPKYKFRRYQTCIPRPEAET